MLVIAGAFAYRVFGGGLMRAALVPTAKFAPPIGDAGAPDYASDAGWIAKPGIANDASAWRPTDFDEASEDASGNAAVFFVHPTSYLQKERWNAPLDDGESRWRARLFVQSQASAFANAGRVWAPRYRQATFGAFLTSEADAQRALDFAYQDIERAFDAFLRQAPADAPLILAGHSQGALHVVRLLHERVRGTPLARRVVAAYPVGWPITLSADLPGLGLPGCERADQAGCVLTWQSFAEPAEPEQITAIFDETRGLNGRPRRGEPLLCVNPLTGTRDGAAPAEANPGTLIPNAELTKATLQPRAVPARCAPEQRGVLLIGDPPSLGPYVLPGNNYHVYDYALFWSATRADAARRLAAFNAR